MRLSPNIEEAFQEQLAVAESLLADARNGPDTEAAKAHLNAARWRIVKAAELLNTAEAQRHANALALETAA